MREKARRGRKLEEAMVERAWRRNGNKERRRGRRRERSNRKGAVKERIK